MIRNAQFYDSLVSPTGHRHSAVLTPSLPAQVLPHAFLPPCPPHACKVPCIGLALLMQTHLSQERASALGGQHMHRHVPAS